MFGLRQFVEQRDGEPSERKVDEGAEEQREEGVERARTYQVGCLGEVLHGDIAHDGCTLDKSDYFAFVDRGHASNGLRQHDVNEGLHGGESHGYAGFGLSVVDAFNGGAEHFADVGGEVHGKGNDGDCHTAHLQRGKEYVEHEHEENKHGYSAHDGDVASCHIAQRFSSAHAKPADYAAKHGAEQCGANGDEHGDPQSLEDELVAVLLDDVGDEAFLHIVHPCAGREAGLFGTLVKGEAGRMGGVVGNGEIYGLGALFGLAEIGSGNVDLVGDHGCQESGEFYGADFRGTLEGGGKALHEFHFHAHRFVVAVEVVADVTTHYGVAEGFAGGVDGDVGGHGEGPVVFLKPVAAYFLELSALDESFKEVVELFAQLFVVLVEGGTDGNGVELVGDEVDLGILPFNGLVVDGGTNDGVYFVVFQQKGQVGGGIGADQGLSRIMLRHVVILNRTQGHTYADVGYVVWRIAFLGGFFPPTSGQSE